ncbi:hypothetical protein FBZ94_1076 [Bradyrhizobium sacchari]|uniref:Uncharacterized protein n=1 Tax=Bradyrhizobium sacchari TaxID=1399419 RepID=A0A560K776_9BRAD|nr:hypothetical protein FBZ94_1076 [Bradyrhizobium sacchari]TWB79201.1 hypothetical protein FBZ95_1031053 [Bradyrhizobium sacchari]
MGMREEIRADLPGVTCGLVEVPRDREEALRAKKPAIGDLRQPACAQCPGKLAAHLLPRFGVVDRHVALPAPGVVVTGERCNALEDRRLPGAILPDDDRDGGLEVELEIIRKDRQAERISLAVADLRWIEPNPFQVRRQVDRSTASSAHARLPARSDPLLPGTYQEHHLRESCICEAYGNTRQQSTACVI